ncbi:hypothetical protein COO91_04634 [Nostoc flagelliforme CCNUN1]|uniref:Uncharacterized protein n=1 Tax=Nostoc flagelliforme CCNUN1 TaxID=2038116 RepID=A0A2K8ST76_9NOSO|nr:hypothetical protein COO91_04634 [Nostoc flagelliforme CCNUN1]
MLVEQCDRCTVALKFSFSNSPTFFYFRGIIASVAILLFDFLMHRRCNPTLASIGNSLFIKYASVTN